MRRQEHVHVEIEMPTYLNAELDAFGDWLDKFRTEKEVVVKKREKIVEEGKKPRMVLRESKMTINPINIQEAQFAFGALSKKNHVGVDTYQVILKPTSMDGGRMKAYERPSKLELFEHKYQAWSRRKFAIGKKLEGYDDMAQQEEVTILAEDKSSF